MNRKIKTLIFIVLFGTVMLSNVIAQEVTRIDLPEPVMSGGKPLMDVFKSRCSQRSFSNQELTLQSISNLLWAANGINRPDSKKRTAPTAMNDQEIEVYLANKDGVYVYLPEEHAIELVESGDLRGKFGIQGFVKDAPVILIYVADYKKMSSLMSKEDKDFYAATDVGFVSQNVYLFCASEGLATVVLGMVSRDSAAKSINLDSGKKIMLTQCVGYPLEK
ncbi:MAG: SagB/ThcOx family dehydrogenase [Bacteroidales bacterium]|nr:SagB/ThcOx family dehydrogenase [Bacteroidales bacterium]HOY39653.1 SagB/ThcOx family dehydrogenase [Bacteroidales bacterium]HQP04461.1 SagB/ThcOx family dehydrogenase [Bacteroidales bacterium]